MPGIGGRFGWNEPPPAAITTTLQAIVVLASVRTRKPLSVRSSSVTISPKWNSGAERPHLLDQLVDQPLRRDHRPAGNVVDRLLRIELGALPARPVEDVDQVALQVEQAKLEHGEQPAWAGANDDDIRFGEIRTSSTTPVWLRQRRQACRAGTVTTRPSSSSVTWIWQDSREFGLQLVGEIEHVLLHRLGLAGDRCAIPRRHRRGRWRRRRRRRTPPRCRARRCGWRSP